MVLGLLTRADRPNPTRHDLELGHRPMQTSRSLSLNNSGARRLHRDSWGCPRPSSHRCPGSRTSPLPFTWSLPASLESAIRGSYSRHCATSNSSRALVSDRLSYWHSHSGIDAAPSVFQSPRASIARAMRMR